MCKCACICACVCETAQTFYRLFLAVWTCSNCWDSSYSYIIRSWGQQATLCCYSLCCGSNRSLPRLATTAKLDLIVQNSSITLRCAPFHRQGVLSGRRNKSHSTHLIRCCRLQALQIYNWLNQNDNVQYTGLVHVLNMWKQFKHAQISTASYNANFGHIHC